MSKSLTLALAAQAVIIAQADGQTFEVALDPRLADPELNLTDRVILQKLYNGLDVDGTGHVINLDEFAQKLSCSRLVIEDSLLTLSRKGYVRLPNVQIGEIENLIVPGICLAVESITNEKVEEERARYRKERTDAAQNFYGKLYEALFSRHDRSDEPDAADLDRAAGEGMIARGPETSPIYTAVDPAATRNETGERLEISVGDESIRFPADHKGEWTSEGENGPYARNDRD